MGLNRMEIKEIFREDYPHGKPLIYQYITDRSFCVNETLYDLSVIYL